MSHDELSHKDKSLVKPSKIAIHVSEQFRKKLQKFNAAEKVLASGERTVMNRESRCRPEISSGHSEAKHGYMTVTKDQGRTEK